MIISGAYINVDLYDALTKALRTEFKDSKNALLDAIIEAICDCDEEEVVLKRLSKQQPDKMLQYLKEYHSEDMVDFVLEEEGHMKMLECLREYYYEDMVNFVLYEEKRRGNNWKL